MHKVRVKAKAMILHLTNIFTTGLKSISQAKAFGYANLSANHTRGVMFTGLTNNYAKVFRVFKKHNFIINGHTIRHANE